MAVTLQTYTKNYILDTGLCPLFNSGKLKFETSGGAALATLTFGATAFGAAANGVATANAITQESSATAGTIGKASMYKSDNTTKLLECTVGTSGADINISSLTLGTGDIVQCSALTLTQP